MSKLKNIKALRQMLDGTHRSQTKTSVGFSDTAAQAAKNKKREVGEVWEEKDISGNSIWYEQKDGYRVSTNVHPEVAAEIQRIREALLSFPNCRKEVCTCSQPTRLDEKFRRMVGMCEECLVSYETHLKMTGQFNEYALKKMEANANSFFQMADSEVEILLKAADDINFAGDESDINPIEKWSFQDPESFKKMIREQYETFKQKTMERFTE